MNNERIYFGILYWKDEDTKEWFCDIINEPFKTKKDVLFYIKDSVGN